VNAGVAERKWYLRLIREVTSMKIKLSIPLAAAIVLLPGAPIYAQMTGTSHPEELDDTKPSVPVDDTHYVKPSPAVPAATVTVTTPAPVLYQHNPSTPPTEAAAANSVDPTLNVSDDVNSGVVTSVPVGPNDLPIGTRLKGILQQPISTQTTRAGSRFMAALTQDLKRNGVVFLPAGSMVYGRITQIHGGRRISGPSAIRLQPESVSLPDGTTYKLIAEVTDLDHFEDSHVNSEGTIVGNVHPGTTAAAVGLTTTTAVIAGAVIGGGVGAVVGLGVGAGVATVWWLKHDRQQELPSGTEIVFTLNNPLHINPATH
jgi:hypothetical protein